MGCVPARLSVLMRTIWRRGSGQCFLAPMRTHLRAANCKRPSYGSSLPTTATSLAFTRSGDPEGGRDRGRKKVPQAPLSPPGLLPVAVHPPEWFHRRLVAGAPEIVTLSPAEAESERDGA